MAMLALSAAWPCTVLCAVPNCRKVSDPKNHPMLIGLQPYVLLSHTPANPALVAVHFSKNTSRKRQMPTRSSCLNSTFKLDWWGVPPPGFPGMHGNASTMP